MTTCFHERVARVKATVSVQSLFERDGHKLIRSSGLLKTCCPFHRESTPSCYIFPAGNWWCFGCGRGSDVLDYVMIREGCNIIEALNKLDGGMPLMPPIPLPPLPRRQAEPELPESYFTERMARWADDTNPEQVLTLGESLGVAGECLFALNVAWAEEHSAWAIPMRNSDGRVVGIRLRDESGKKWAVKGSKQGLFIPNVESKFDLVVTEGPTDCAAVLSMGLFAVGKPMAMMSSDQLLKFIAARRIRRVIVIADNDHAGLVGAAKLIDVCPVPTCELVLPTKDVREFAQIGGSRSLLDSMLANQNWKRKNQ